MGYRICRAQIFAAPLPISRIQATEGAHRSSGVGRAGLPVERALPRSEFPGRRDGGAFSNHVVLDLGSRTAKRRCVKTAPVRAKIPLQTPT